jgi:hypothetical protein
MGRSLLPVAKAPVPPVGLEYHNPFEALGSRFLAERKDGRLFQRRTRSSPDGRTAAEAVMEIDYVLGSGGHGLTFLANREGYVSQVPLSWYASKKEWGLAPGFREILLTGRPISAECFFCHANRVNYIEGSLNHYSEPAIDGYRIGCQRCHGPGELHVASRASSEPAQKPDFTIVNPRRLEPALREAVCEQCHLQGAARILCRGRDLYDFRPGLPLEAFWSVFLRSATNKAEQRSVGQVEQMYESRCFQRSQGPEQLGCISCHDPHTQARPAERVPFYRDRCLRCHEKRGCSLPLSERLQKTAEDSCIDCHMPRYASADIPHATSIDHRILRHGKPVSRPDARLDRREDPPLISFYSGRTAWNATEDERGRGLALIKLARAGTALAPRVLSDALEALERACRRDPEDLAAEEARGYALAIQNRWAEALAAFQAVLARAPETEVSILGAASTAEELGRIEVAETYWRRALAVNPWEPGYQGPLVRLLLKRSAWAEAETQCQAWIRLDPFSAEAREARIKCLLAIGNKVEARAEFKRIEALAPLNLRELQIRYEVKLR